MVCIIVLATCITVFLFIVGGYSFLQRLQRQRLEDDRLRRLAQAGDETGPPSIVRRRIFSEIPWLNRILEKITRLKALDRLLEQADSKYPAGVFILLSLFLATFGLLAGLHLANNPAISIVASPAAAVAPFYYLIWKRGRRIQKFQKQLPEALDLIARALKAGHSLYTGLKMVADESGDPLGPEFAKALAEIQYGAGVNQALKNLSMRMSSLDLRFVITAILIQRETGGNLAEVLEKIAYLIRERFKLNDRIRTLSAEGRLSAAVLIGLPFFIALVLMMINPDYLKPLTEDPAGRAMLLAAGLLLVTGILIMRRLIRIKV